MSPTSDTMRSVSRGQSSSSQGEEGEIIRVILTRDAKCGFGLSLTNAADTESHDIIIRRVAPGSPAEVIGLIDVGDKIVMVNGKSLAGMPISAAVDIFAKSGPKLDLKLQKQRGRYTPVHAYANLAAPVTQTGTEDTPLPPLPQEAPSRYATLLRSKPATADTLMRHNTGISASGDESSGGGGGSTHPFVFDVSREVAKSMLKSQPSGTFLIRPSGSIAGDFILAVSTGSQVEQIGPLGIREAKLQQFVEHHRKAKDSLPVLLTNVVKR